MSNENVGVENTNNNTQTDTDEEQCDHPLEQVLPHVKFGLAKCGVCGKSVEYGDCSGR